MQFFGLSDAILLVALGIGYVVLYLAKREEKALQFTGYLIGGVIIVLSLIYILGNLLVKREYQSNMLQAQKMMMQKRTMQPRQMPQAPVPRGR